MRKVRAVGEEGSWWEEPKMMESLRGRGRRYELRRERGWKPMRGRRVQH